ncbi:adipokinetic hormone/corazonin-related peptide receptor variant I-like [Ylistrum balloti]|uniref:adipokinetic hormone/corazonin-related peptide receptor variant I-like n=1 Tax=Ylistrum balloti TaxID=509963 RepID=UPI002905C475|nr:adipokinetic hormone/corazonin-related peptide receptor variant I-like [Ylistrum balloti]
MDYQDSIFSTFHNKSSDTFQEFPEMMFQVTTPVGCVPVGSDNVTEYPENTTLCKVVQVAGLPQDMTFNENSVVAVAAYTCLFVVAACGNLTVFITLFRNRHVKSRVNLFILHLSIADLIVTFIMLPMEISWHITVAWTAGDLTCRILMFFRAFGLYLSSFILVTISLDRYFAILHPLSLNDADKRGKIMLTLAWSFSLVASIPQSVIFHVEHHPQHPWYTQCVTFNFFPTAKHELAYNLFNIITLYALPLLIISASYSLILLEISKKTRQSREETGLSAKARSRLRRSSMGNIRRARTRTLKMTLVIVSVFVLCWTPYFVISAWWWFDKDSAKKLDPKIQKGLFLFAVSNSCMDPIVYGMFTINFKRELVRCCCCLKTAMQRQKLRGEIVRYQSSTRRTPANFKNGSYFKGKFQSNQFYEDSDVDTSTGLSRFSGTVDSPRTGANHTQVTPGTASMSSKCNNESRANINNFMTLKLPIDTEQNT